MKLPFLGKKEHKEYFLALLLRDEKATAVIFEELQGKIRVVAEAQEYFEDSIEDATIDEWLNVLDKAISNAESILPQGAKLSKTIFGVTEHWVEESKIKKEYLTKLKKVSDELQLSPIGFLVIHEAITHLLKKEEGAPVSAILVEVGKRMLIISLLRAGKIIETRQTRIEESIPKTTDVLLHHFQGHEILPSRIIVLNANDSEGLSQEFISHLWSRDLPFLHVPQITSLPKRFDAKAVLYGAATQMGFEVLKDSKEELKRPEPLLEEKNEETNQPIAQTPDFGFILEKDVQETHLQPTTDADVVQNQNEDEVEEKPPETIHAQHSPIHHKPKANSSKINMSSITRLFSLNRLLLPFFQSFGHNKKLLFFPPVFLAVCVGIILGYLFLIRSTITLDIAPKVIKQDQEVTFSTDKSSDFAKNSIQVQSVSVSKDGDVSTPATGKKEVGEKAKGTITIYSRRSQETTFLAGTPLAGPNDLEFTLDKDVKVASSSADASANPATAKGSVTAKQIGKESNLPSNAKFSIGTYDTSDVVAKNEQAFSGGSKKEITIVSKADLDKLLDELPKNLEKEAKEELGKKISKDESLLPVLAKPIISKKDFDRDKNAEASTVTLKGTVSYKGYAYKKEALKKFAQELLLDKEQGLELAKDEVVYDIKNGKEKSDNETTGVIHIEGTFFPKINKEKTTEDIVGKSFEDAKEILSKLPQVENVRINLRPNLPFLPEILPYFTKNITFILQSK